MSSHFRSSVNLCYSFAVASNKRAMQPLCCPSPSWGGEEMERNRQKLVGWDKGSLTEQQTKRTGTTTIQIRRIHNTNCRIQRAALTALAAELQMPSCRPAPPNQNPAWWHMVWNTLFCLARLGQPAQLCPFLDSDEKLTLSWPNPGQSVTTEWSLNGFVLHNYIFFTYITNLIKGMIKKMEKKKNIPESTGRTPTPLLDHKKCGLCYMLYNSSFASYLGEENNTCLTTTSFQKVVASDKVPPQPPLLQTKQPQLPQPLLIRLVL